MTTTDRPRFTWPLALAAALLVNFASIHAASGRSAANAASPLGINLNGVTYYSAEQPFLNIFRTSAVSRASSAAPSPQGWVTGGPNIYDTHEEAYLQLDADGYPTSLTASAADPNQPQRFDHVSVLLLSGLGASNGGTGPRYRPGEYVVLYDGRGTLVYTDDARLLRSRPGRDLIQVANPTDGIGINITATDPRDHIRNIRVVYAPYEKLLQGGAVFRPDFIASLRSFRVLRFMDWLDTNDSSLKNWNDRPLLTDAGYGTARGVPLEICLELANAVDADPWVNVPIQATDDYIRQMATLVRDTLHPGLDVYVELSNEVWNNIFDQSRYAVSQGNALWPSRAVSDYTHGIDWFGMRTAQVCDIWKSVWGNAYSRVHCVLGAQDANNWTATEALACPLWTGAGNAPCYKHNITAVAVAPYFGFQVPGAWSSQSLPTQLDRLFAELNRGGLIAGDYPGGYLKMLADRETAYSKALAPYGLPLITYEGGQSFVTAPDYADGSWAEKLYVAANRDPRMGAAYATALAEWKAGGGELYMQFVDVSGSGQYGEWGALESYLDPISPLGSAPPKWQALQAFIAHNPCWWPGCRGKTAAAPAR
jgi:hypothetical protein